MRTAGWEVEYIDLDLTGEQSKADIKVVRADGLWLLARVDHLGRASVERFKRDCFLGQTPNTEGRRPPSPQVNDQFLGRSHYEGARSMLRGLTAYIADNALSPIPLAQVHAGWVAIRGTPLHLEASRS
ncbi:hypothetical protein [Azospirillum canadense]|uniref:hypothetical protein n=1 Tax=Azospirillum canadense TaxID=403962 RepID=UPI002225BE0C|nr:hypothetical protein [Azospirillum canadense]MCW2240745.1 hypothetical protein [Azospirillum canadense]